MAGKTEELIEQLRQLAKMHQSAGGSEIVASAATEAAAELKLLSDRIAVLDWQPIESAWRVGDQRIIVTDGAEVHGAAWWHSGEEAWLDCGGITPTHWMPLPEPPIAPQEEHDA